MKSVGLALAICCLAFVSHVTNASLTIGGFNVQRLSDNKVKNTTIVADIVTILLRFDIATIEEVLHETAMQLVLDELNRQSHNEYSMTLSEKMGTTSYKEYLAIIYRTDKVTLRNTLKYHDDGQEFEREPYSALFHSTQTQVADFAIMGVHLKPANVVDEMDVLPVAYDHASGVFGTKNFLIMGDFNADCRYLSTTNYHNSALWKDDRFYFVLNAAADTTVSHNTNCAYDRFVTAGVMRSAVVPNSVRVFNFETGLHLSYDEAHSISDHYPIELQLA